MRLSRKYDKILLLLTVFAISAVFGVTFARDFYHKTYAGNESGIYTESEDHFVTFYDEGEKLIVKTNAVTVREALERADILLDETDLVDPGLDTVIDMDNFFINIHRSHPAVIKDGSVSKYIMTASFDGATVAREAGFTLYDGDEATMVPNASFLEAGTANVYQISRNGGRSITVETEIDFPTTEVKDYNLAVGSREVRELGELGLKRAVYEVLYIDGVEASRTLISEEVVREPVARVVAVGAKRAASGASPSTEECASWARAAGVSEANLSAALDLIYHESGCRVGATNASSGAYGIPQALPGSKMASAGADWETNPVTQIRWMIKYVTGRYGGWEQARTFWYAHGWY